MGTNLAQAMKKGAPLRICPSDLTDLQPQIPRSGMCGCGGLPIEKLHPVKTVAWAIICESCGKWLRCDLSYGHSYHPLPKIIF